MNRDQLSERSGLPAHQIRYLVSEGILPPADARGRSADAYSEEHLRLAVRYVRLHASGMRKSAIREALARGDAADGTVIREGCVELRVTDGDGFASMDDGDVGELAAALWRALIGARDEARRAATAVAKAEEQGKGD